MGYNIGPKIGIDGEREFRKAIRDINDAYKTLDAETRAVTAAFDAQGDEQGKLEAASKQLQKQIDAQKGKMKLLEDAVKKASDKFGENSIEATRLRGALFDTQATVSKLESELGDTQARLSQAGKAMEDFADSADDAGDAAIDLGDIISGNLVSDLILDGLRELGSLVKDFAVGSADAAAEVQASTAQFQQTFGMIETSAKTSLESIEADTGIASTRIQGYFTTLYAFAKNAGMGQAEALNLSSRAMLAAADNAAYYDKTMEQATEQLQSFLKGNYENDAALGISATETTRNAKANELYAKSFKELSEAQKVDTLLAMVEAGNEASGAIGQAARESDSWANVTAELAEVFRLIQAEAGKPALKKLTPIIQKITKAGYELIEEMDWDRFGDTVADIADGVIEHGPGVVKAIAAIAAGIVAMKATQKVGEMVSLAQSILSVGTAAQTASATVAASGAALSVTPWGAVATAIGAAVALIIACSDNTKSAADELRGAMDRLDESVANANSQYKDAKLEVDGAAGAAKYYVDRLRELEQAGLDTAVAHREYELVVGELNKLIPDLNLVIDEQTGLIQGSTDELYANIEAWQKNATQRALQEKFTDVIEARSRAESELYTAQAKLNLLQKKENELNKETAPKLEKIADAKKELAEASSKYWEVEEMGVAASDEALAIYREKEKVLNDLVLDYGEHTRAISNNQQEQQSLSKAITEAENIVASYADEVALAEEATHLFAEETETAADDQTELNKELEKVQQAMQDLEAEYADACKEARTSIDTQIGLFEDLSQKGDWSADKIIKNWDSQKRAFDNYSANLQKAVDMGLDETLVKQLSDGSAESMQILDALVGEIGTDVSQINLAFSGMQESRSTVATVVGGIQTDFNTKMSELEAAAESAGKDIPTEMADGIKTNSGKVTSEITAIRTGANTIFNGLVADAEQAGIDTGKGIAKGLQSQYDWVESSIRTLASDKVIGVYKRVMDQHSPSRVMENITGDTVEGGVIGIQKNADRFESSMEDLAFAGRAAFMEGQMDATAFYPQMVGGSVSNVTNRSTNYGGVTFQIYQQPGESAEDLYHRMMDIMQHEVEAKEAAF